MKASEVVKEFLTNIEKNDFKKAENLTAKNFVVEGVGPTSLNITEFLGVHRALNTGLPDFRFNHKIERETTDQVNVTVQLSGTHKNDMR